MTNLLEIELTNFPLAASVKAFQDRLRIGPVAGSRIRETIERNPDRAVATVSAILFLNTSLLETLSVQIGGQVDLPHFLPRLCELLSFASRCGVGFVPSSRWWNGDRPPLRGGSELQGPLETPKEIGLLLDRGLLRLYTPAFEYPHRRLTAFRWFLGWQREPALELKLIRLWNALEILAGNCGGRSAEPSAEGGFEPIPGYLAQLSVTPNEALPLSDLYRVKEALLKGDAEIAQAILNRYYEQPSPDRSLEVLTTPYAGAPALPGLNPPNRYASALHEAVQQLAEFMETVFYRLLVG